MNDRPRSTIGARVLPRPPAVPPIVRPPSAAEPDKTHGHSVHVDRPTRFPAERVAGSASREALLAVAHQHLCEAHGLYLHAQAQAMQGYVDVMSRLRQRMLAGGPPEPLDASVAAPPALPREDPAGPVPPMPTAEAVAAGLPGAPLRLCDRVVHLSAGRNGGLVTTRTATDVDTHHRFMHHGRFLTGSLVESGQAWRALVAQLASVAERGDRPAARLLGGELSFGGEPPGAGDTIECEIRVDPPTAGGDPSRILVEYDCRVGGRPCLSLRRGQVDLAAPATTAAPEAPVWSVSDVGYTEGGRAQAGGSPTAKTRFGRAEVQAYLDGEPAICFGPTHAWADTHTRTARGPADDRNLIGEVVALDFAGGPAGRGYMRVETELRGDGWFFADPDEADAGMPFGVMVEACLQAMAFYMAAGGATLRRDGWRFQPVPGSAAPFACGRPATPRSHRLACELFVDDASEGEHPRLRAHALCTVDGHRAFACEGLALELVPDWPLTSMPDLLAEVGRPDPRPVAAIDGFPLDHRSLIQCALGRPTRAFGERFAHYDGTTRPARLPGPPYHFMTRIAALSGEMMSMAPGTEVTALYDVPADAWYFGENGAATMPTCVLLEVALQPCGWLATYTLRREPGASELLFRNLDGEAVQHREVRPGDRTVTTHVELVSLDRTGDLIIEKFKVRCTVDGEPLFDVETVFGFFPPQAMADQKGFGQDRAASDPPPAEVLDLTSRPERLFARRARLADGTLLMVDRITGFWPKGGSEGLGLIRGERDIVPGDWFFKAHFFQDPVQPGSLGIEGMLQLAQAFMLLEGLEDGMASPRFEPLAIGRRAEWHYRGQVTPDCRRMAMEFEVLERGVDASGPFVVGRATLSVDGLQIYRAPRLGMRLVEGAGAAAVTREVAWRLDSAGDTAWVNDHRPTFSVPALPFTYELEMSIAAAAPLFPGRQVIGVRRAVASRWIAFQTPIVEGRTEVVVTGPGEAKAVVQVLHEGRLANAFTAEVLFGTIAAAEPVHPLDPLVDARPIDDLYRMALFHGPALQLMRDLEQGSNGASGSLDDARCPLPRGLSHPGLLDGALHSIPHDDPGRWSPGLPPGLAGYPVMIENLRLFDDLAAGGPMRVESRILGVEGARLMRTHIRLLRDGVVKAMFDFVEILMPKGILGIAPDRWAFLGERRHVPGVALAVVTPAVTTLARRTCAESDWLPGTVAGIYRLQPGEDLAVGVAMRDHAAGQLRLHPGDLSFDADGRCRNLPLNPWCLEREDRGDAVTVRSDRPGALDWRWVQASWRARSGAGQSFVQDLGIAMVQRFVGRVILADPAGFEALAGRPVLYLGNHQTGVESTLFLLIAVTLSGLPAGAIAKLEHGASWVGKIRTLADAAMGEANPLGLHLFDRSNPADLLRLLRAYGEGLERRPSSLLIHTDGTRAVKAGAPVGAVSSVLIDLSLAHGLPIVPVRFAGGLPLEPAAERLEFPAGAGRQDYFIGPAIAPETLGAMAFGERSAFVRDRINALGPRNLHDAPLPGDPAFARGVAAGRAQGLDPVQSHLRAALSAFPDLGEQSARLLRDPAADPSALVAELAPLLIGAAPRGGAA